MMCPVNYVAVTQQFGTHKGVDFGWFNHHNQWVYAVDDGEIIYNRHQVTGGYVIHLKIKVGESYYVAEYGHLLKNSQLVREKMHVKKGQKLAKMGKSGLGITGEHLHFGLYKGSYINYKDKSKFVDPLKYLNLYDNQKANEKTEKLIKRTKHAEGIPSEPLNIRYKSKNGKVVGSIYNGDQVEHYYITDEGWNCLDNLRDYVCSNRYLK